MEAETRRGLVVTTKAQEAREVTNQMKGIMEVRERVEKRQKSRNLMNQRSLSYSLPTIFTARSSPSARKRPTMRTEVESRESKPWWTA